MAFGMKRNEGLTFKVRAGTHMICEDSQIFGPAVPTGKKMLDNVGFTSAELGRRYSKGSNSVRWRHLKIVPSERRQLEGNDLGGFKKSFTAEPPRGRNFSEMIRIRARKSGFGPESRSYGPKVRVTAGQTARIRTELPSLGASTENPP